MKNNFLIACVAVILFNMSVNTLINISEIGKPEVQEETNGSVVVEDNKETEKEEDNEPEEPQAIVNNIDNSTTNNDNSTVVEKYYYYVEKKEDEVVSAPANNPSTNNYTNNSSSVNNNTTTKPVVNSNQNKQLNIPIGDERNDTNSDPNIVHIKGIKCPQCGNNSYIEHYNKLDTNLQHYMGNCSTCYYNY